MKQQQFLDVVTEEQARARLEELARGLRPQVEALPLGPGLLGRELAEDVRSAVDVPGFDRSNVDGFAVISRETWGAEETAPRRLRLAARSIAAGEDPSGIELQSGEVIPIATGAVVPRGADAVIMIEDTLPADDDGAILLTRGVAPGAHISWAGTDLGRGEVVLFRGASLGARETGLLAAVGVTSVPVFRRPRVLVVSTGDEVRPPGATLKLGEIYDSNARIVADAVTEAGGEPRFLGIFPDDEAALETALAAELARQDGLAPDLIVLSGGTSKGKGDINGRVVASLAERIPDSAGIVVHGVALKPGKPLCLAGVGGRVVAILPGFPTSAIFTFHEFLRPLIRRLAGRSGRDEGRRVAARAPLRIASVAGRTQYVLVSLVAGADGLSAYPMGSGSGSVSTFSRADGFLRIDRHCEVVEEGEAVEVVTLSARDRAADLVVIGSHCVGVDLLAGELNGAGFRTKIISVGSSAGLAALGRGEGHIAGTHLLDAEGRWNVGLLPAGTTLIKGYGRRQGFVFRAGDARFEGLDAAGLTELVRGGALRMVHRNRGSGTRALIEELLAGVRPPGYEVQARSHHAVAAAVAQGRADWGVTLAPLARDVGLGFVPLRDEEFDFAVRDAVLEEPAVKAFLTRLRSERVAEELAAAGCVVRPLED